jgi:hypothetical protein
MSGDAIAADDVLPEDFFIVAELTLLRGFALIHFMKYSTATMANV